MSAMALSGLANCAECPLSKKADMARRLAMSANVGRMNRLSFGNL